MLTFIALATLFQVLIWAGVRRILQRNTVALRRLDTLLRQQRANERVMPSSRPHSRVRL